MTAVYLLAPRLPQLAGIPRAMRCYRLPSYSHLRGALAEVAGVTVQIVTLWQSFFGDGLPEGRSEFDMLVTLVARIDAELFPIDMLAMDDLQNMIWSTDDGDWHARHVSVLDMPLPLMAYGIPWEMADLHECRQDAVPLLAVLGEQLEEHAQDYGFDPDGFLQAVADYWTDRDREPPAWGIAETGTSGILVLQEALRLLPAPLNALGDLVDCILRDTGSPWLDRVGGGYECEYEDDYDPWDYGEDWNAETIRRTAALFVQVRPAVERIDAYEKWFDETKDAEDVVLTELECLVAGAWAIQDGEVIYYD